jgi:hypothetical protein
MLCLRCRPCPWCAGPSITALNASPRPWPRREIQDVAQHHGHEEDDAEGAHVALPGYVGWVPSGSAIHLFNCNLAGGAQLGQYGEVRIWDKTWG